MEFGLLATSRFMLFILISIFFVVMSRRTLCNPMSHGFYRFFAFESILALVLLNIPFWMINPFAPTQLLSWILLSFSIFLVFRGLHLLRKLGGHKARKDSTETFSFEDTAVLVTDGIYKYVRHPMYSSLLFLAWGAYLKDISLYSTIAVSFATTALIATAKNEERGNISYFGSAYEDYITKTKMFIPYLL